MAGWLAWADPTRLPGGRAAIGSLQHGVSDLLNLALDRTVRLAITGLRQSGKTVFITAIVHHLLNGRELPFFTPAKENRLLGARLTPTGLGGPPPFPFLESRAALAALQPAWPAPTRDLSTLRLDLRIRPTGLIARQFGEHRTQRIDIIDYPGEWLLDLPMLEQDFATWSAEAIRRASSLGWRDAAARFLSAVGGLDAHAAVDLAQAAALAGRYRDALAAAQAAGMSLLQPGRITMPGDLAGSELLDFCPLPPAGSGGGLHDLMAQRYERYRDQVVRPFYADHFSRFDRQIVLVDLLTSLNRGPAVFADTEAALETVLKSFRYGTSGLLARLFRPRIDTLLFAATKADHVAHNQHHNLRLLLEQMVVGPSGRARFEGLEPVFMALASVRSTDTVKTEHEGQTLSCVRGRLKGEDRETVLFPGEIPPEPPTAADWQADHFRFRDFAPRRLALNGAGRPQHIRLDQALEVLLGDRLR